MALDTPFAPALQLNCSMCHIFGPPLLSALRTASGQHAKFPAHIEFVTRQVPQLQRLLFGRAGKVTASYALPFKFQQDGWVAPLLWLRTRLSAPISLANCLQCRFLPVFTGIRHPPNRFPEIPVLALPGPLQRLFFHGYTCGAELCLLACALFTQKLRGACFFLGYVCVAFLCMVILAFLPFHNNLAHQD